MAGLRVERNLFQISKNGLMLLLDASLILSKIELAHTNFITVCCILCVAFPECHRLAGTLQSLESAWLELGDLGASGSAGAGTVLY